jgi:hypothetical protein
MGNNFKEEAYNQTKLSDPLLKFNVRLALFLFFLIITHPFTLQLERF